MSVLVQIQEDSIQIEKLLWQSTKSHQDFGAQVTFTGFVRQHDHQKPITHLEIQYYPDVTEGEIYRIIAVAQKNWLLDTILVVHRVGKIAVGEPIVFVLTQSAHRAEAYSANEFILDYLKTSAPFWKKECFEHGTEHWVQAKQSDQVRFQSWDSVYL